MDRADRIAVLELLVSTQLGGGSRHVLDLVRRLPTHGFHVIVAAPPDGPMFDRLAAIAGGVIPLRVDCLRPSTLAAVIRIVRERGIRVIHSHGKGPGLYGRLAGRWTGVPAIHTMHGIDLSRLPAPARPLYLALERGLLTITRYLIHVSASQAQEARAIGLAIPRRSRIVMNGIDADEIRRHAEPRSVARQALGLSPSAVVLGCVARFDKRKGLSVVLEALQLLSSRHPDAVLVLIGSGAIEGELREQAQRAAIADKVRFAGPIVDAHRVLAALDVYVSASEGEGLPLSLLEAMACAVPIVATRVTGHVDVVVDGITGWLTRAGDAVEFAWAIGRLLDDPDQRRRMGQAGHERVQLQFGADRMTAETAALFREALGEAPTSSGSQARLRI